MAQLSTAVSDAVLAAAGISAAWHLHQSSPNWHLHLASMSIPVYKTPLFGILGFLSISLAASFGVVRFGMANPPQKLRIVHQSLSWLAGLLGMSCLAVHFNFFYEKFFFGWLHLLDAVVVLLVSLVLPVNLSAILEQLQQAAVVLSIVIVCFLNQNWYGVLGSQLVAIAGLTIGTEGYVFNMPAVDAFHYTLVCAVYLMSRALATV